MADRAVAHGSGLPDSSGLSLLHARRGHGPLCESGRPHGSVLSCDGGMAGHREAPRLGALRMDYHDPLLYSTRDGYLVLGMIGSVNGVPIYALSGGPFTNIEAALAFGDRVAERGA